jgi:type I restriction enzyme M protein
LFEQTFKNIDDVLHKDAGCGSELDYVEQSSWVLFLKYLEKERESAASLSGKPYEPILRDEYRWGFGPCLAKKTVRSTTTPL